jgi:hypothetical protein
MIDDELLRDHAEAIAALPIEDPLRRALARSVHALPDEAQALLDAEAELLRRALAQVEVPQLTSRLRVPTRGRARLVALFAIAAGLLLAFVLGQRFAPVADAPPAMINEAAIDPAPTRGGARVIAVKWWHEECPACKELDPRYAEVMASFDESEVLFVTLDMSTEHSRQQSALLASTLGIRDVYDEVFGGSGFVLLFDATSKRKLGQLSAAQRNDEMKSSIREALTRSRS